MADEKRMKRRSWVRRFFLMEEVIAQASAGVGGAGERGTLEARSSLAMAEAAEALAGRRVRLELSDGSAAAFGLYREAAWWALRAHVVRHDLEATPPASLAELWDNALRGPAGPHVATLDAAVLERAREAFVSRGWETTAAAEDVRLAELRALREVVTRLTDPLEAGMARLSRLRIMRVARLGVVVVVAAALVVSVGFAWRSHQRGPNLALHKQTSSSSKLAGYESTSGAVDGNRSDLGFHTTQEERPWLLVDLGETKQIRQVVVYNREDCCRDRAVPLKLEASLDGQQFHEIARRDFEFSKWRAQLPATDVRYLRFTAEKKTWLHFNEIEVYPGQ